MKKSVYDISAIYESDLIPRWSVQASSLRSALRVFSSKISDRGLVPLKDTALVCDGVLFAWIYSSSEDRIVGQVAVRPLS